MSSKRKPYNTYTKEFKLKHKELTLNPISHQWLTPDTLRVTLGV